jgi:hypothetical protein
MQRSSVEALKSSACLVAIPVVVYGAVIYHPQGIVAVLLWLLGAASLVGCFRFLGSMLDEHGERWTLLIPGALALCGAGFVSFIVFIGTGPDHPTSLIAAMLIIGLGFTRAMPEFG